MSRELREAIQAIAGTQLMDEVFLIKATVTAIDPSTRTCTCTAISGQGVTDILLVELMPSVTDGLYVIPSINSVVSILFSNRENPKIIQYSEIDSVAITLSTGQQLDITSNGIQFNDGSKGGLVEIVPLITAMNNLQNTVNTMQIALQLACTALSIPFTSHPLSLSNRIDLENTLITHGS